MKIITANRLTDGRVIYLGENGLPVESLGLAGRFDEQAAQHALARAAGNPAVFVNPYAVEVQVPGGADSKAGSLQPSGRDRLKETIRSVGPSVGNSLRKPTPAAAGSA